MTVVFPAQRIRRIRRPARMRRPILPKPGGVLWPEPPQVSANVYRQAAIRGDSLRLDLSGTESPSLHVVGAISGVAILAAAGRNGPGTGRIRTDGTLLSWRAPGSSTFGSTVLCAVDGNYHIEDGEDQDKWVRVQVDVSYLASGPAEALVHLSDQYDNAAGHDDVTAGEASAGNTTSWTVTLANDGPMDLLNLKCWIICPSGIAISDDNATWVTPTNESHADVFSVARLAAGGTTSLYVQRTISAGATYNPSILTQLAFAWDGY